MAASNERADPPASFRERVCSFARQIPPGRVATYGDLARMAGAPRAAREVGWVMASLPAGSDVPWWRVVNQRGGISPRPGMERQAALLREEGVAVSAEYTLDLPRHRWDPE